MRSVVQRVKEASVTVENNSVGKIGRGLLILLGAARGDTQEEAVKMARKIAALRIFEDPQGKMNLSVRDIQGEALVVSQFTLLADSRKGNRPSFNKAAPPGEAIPLYEIFVETLKESLEKSIPTGVFGAAMEVSLINEGPVTLVLDSREGA